MVSKFKTLMVTLFTAYVTLLLLLFMFQRHLQYVPTGNIADVSQYHLSGFSQQLLTTEDSLTIFSWYKKPALATGKMILYFHGNAGNLGNRAEKFATFTEGGFGILAISYRGYSRSQGKPSQDGLMMDAKAALAFLLQQGYRPQDIILFGESLGSGVAVQLAAKDNFHAVILESPFSSIASVAQKIYWFAPVKILLKDRFESIKVIAKVQSPVLIIHGTADKVVPYEEGQRLFEKITAKRKFISVKNGKHVDFGSAFLLREMNTFLSENQTI